MTARLMRAVAAATEPPGARPGPPDIDSDPPPTVPDDWLIDAVAALEAPPVSDHCEPRMP